MDYFLTFLHMLESLPPTTGLQAQEFLVFAGVSFAAMSLGYVLKMNRLIFQCNWEIQEAISGREISISSLPRVDRIPSNLFILEGLILLLSIVLALFSTVNAIGQSANGKGLQTLLLGTAFVLTVLGIVLLLAAVILNFLMTYFDRKIIRYLRPGSKHHR